VIGNQLTQLPGPDSLITDNRLLITILYRREVNMAEKLWGGRFRKKTDELMERFGTSLPFDCRLYRADIKAGIAHARVLREGGYITAKDRDGIIMALREIEKELAMGKVDLSSGYEDIHSLVLGMLAAKSGDLGEKLHAGRSRNDLVVLDTRIYLKEEICGLIELIRGLQSALVDKGIEYRDLIMPGYTHLQHAQSVLVPHHLLAYVEMLERDRSRLEDSRERMDFLPAGSAAMGGSNLKLDQKLLAELLGFKRLAANSLDAVGDRDFIVESLSALALTGMHLSRLAGELVLWSTTEFNFVELDEAYSTGSSFLPQKKNPDPAELVRGKAGRLYGNLLSVLVALKGLPLAYNRDLQEDKEPLFDSLDTVRDSLAIMAGVIKTLKFNAGITESTAARGFSTAPDLAEYLVEKGVPFQQAHRSVGELVSWSLREGKLPGDLTLKDLRRFSSSFDGPALKLMTPSASIRNKKTVGSTAPARVNQQLNRWRKKLENGE
jgi:argininosuccinate lyase